MSVLPLTIRHGKTVYPNIESKCTPQSQYRNHNKEDHGCQRPVDKQDVTVEEGACAGDTEYGDEDRVRSRNPVSTPCNWWDQHNAPHVLRFFYPMGEKKQCLGT